MSGPSRTHRSFRAVILGLVLVALVPLAARSEALRQVWGVLTGHRLEVRGEAVPANVARLSEHNIEWVATQPPQEQAEFLLGAAVRHEQGATDLIADYVDGWRGRLKRTPKWEHLGMAALYSNDLRVRAAAIEIDLAVHDVAKTDQSVARFTGIVESNPEDRGWGLWTLGMLGNRGLQTEEIHEFLAEYLYDPDEQTRIWAVEGLAHLGTDATIPLFLEVLGNDPSMTVRERAGCSLAKSGMLTRVQRMRAVPGLVDLAQDPSLDEQPRRWVYQALREITDVSLLDEPAEWRHWYATAGAEMIESFGADPWQVLGNN